MPSYSSKLVLSSAASSSGVAIADVEFIKGAFYTVAEFDELADIPLTRIADGQIVWVEDVTKTYQATITLANPPTSFTDTVAWAEFTGFGGSGGGSGDITSFTKVMARTLKRYIKDGEKSTKKCLICGKEDALIYQEGCKICKYCGDTKCGG